MSSSNRNIEIHRNVIERALMRAKEYVMKNQRQVMYAGVSFIALIIIVVGSIVYYQKQETKELARFERIIDEYRSITDEAKKKTLFDDTVRALVKQTEDSWWGYVKRNGYYFVAGLYFEEKNYKMAQSYYLNFHKKASRSFFAPLALQQAARCSELMDQPQKAIEINLQLEKKYRKSIVLDQVYYDLGRLYQKLGDIFKSKEYFTKVLNNYPRSPFSLKARERLMVAGNLQLKK